MLRPGLSLGAVVLVLDQLTKWLILNVANLPEVQRIPVLAVGPFGFDLTMVWNRGVTFGMLAGDEGWTQLALGALALLIAGLLIRWMSRADTRLVALALGGVVGGAIGNVIDRLRFGAVVDFVDWHAWDWHWYVFNVADAAIVLGVLALALDALFRPSGSVKPSPP
ncbi:signal peptidase II [Falsiroseomonas sp. HW251]|uniref:signal peptidase II n=1 Tax=Falsiroseomonas sp. HW251 TaxID=3390998 RepID=UPI003D3115A3